MVNMDVQKSRARRINGAAQRRLDQINVVKILGTVQVDDEMYASAPHSIALSEMVIAFLRAHHDAHGLPSGGACRPLALIRSQEGVLAHRRPPQPSHPNAEAAYPRQANAARSTQKTDRSQRLVPT
jgi:hypothetical protein